MQAVDLVLDLAHIVEEKAGFVEFRGWDQGRTERPVDGTETSQNQEGKKHEADQYCPFAVVHRRFTQKCEHKSSRRSRRKAAFVPFYQNIGGLYPSQWSSVAGLPPCCRTSICPSTGPFQHRVGASDLLSKGPLHQG